MATNVSSPGCQKEASGEWTIQCQCEDSGQRALEENTCLTSKQLEQRTGPGQTARRAFDVHINCVRSSRGVHELKDVSMCSYTHLQGLQEVEVRDSLRPTTGQQEVAVAE